ncbi:MAG: hypothetical protein H7338_05040, partial [Candidatus Sericytochromatia bacterium]|nr:hypothetical protein [Candidatus Sericytochromatia bacterium]
MALGIPSIWQLASGVVLGLPARAATLDANVVAKFQASVDGKPVTVVWDEFKTTATGES